MVDVHIMLLFCRKTARKPRHRQQGYVQQITSQFRIDELKTFFRVSRASVQDLQEWISSVCAQENISGIVDRVSSGGSAQTPLHERILFTLWYLASQDKYASVADRFGVSESTACTSVRNLLQFIAEEFASIYS